MQQRLKSDNPLATLYRTRPEEYEVLVLAACMKSERLWTGLSKVLCVRDKVKYIEEVNDFSCLEAYVLFRIVKAFHGMSPEFKTPDAVAVATLLATGSCVPQGSVLTDAAKTKVIELAVKAAGYTKENAELFVGPTWRDWLYGVQVNSAITDIRRGGYGEDLTEQVDALSALRERLDRASTHGGDDGLHTFDDIYESEDGEVERIALGQTFTGLNEVLGGGFGKGEYVLAVLPSGGGKTVLSCQIATELALLNRHVLLISTEQKPEDLMPRIFTSMSYVLAPTPDDRLKFKDIKDIPMKRLYPSLRPAQQAIVDRIRKALGPYLHMDKWDSEQGSVGFVEQRLLHYNKLLAEKGEKGIDMLILDWIGSTIQRGAGDNLRFLMLDASDEMFRLAEKHKVACLATCQANDEANGVRLIKAKHIAESKGILRPATAAFGISTMEARLEKGEHVDGASTFSTKQVLNCFKTRKGEAQWRDIIRNFAFQRFDKL